MTNLGIAPPATDTPVGQARQLIGATVFAPLDPPVVGFGDYERFADNEIVGFLAVGGNSPLRAAGHALLQMSTAAALLAVNVGTEDLRVTTEARAKALHDLADSYFKQADLADATAASADGYFAVFDSVD